MAAGWADLDVGLLELDAVLPDQYNQQVAEFTPEQELMQACLLDAIRRYRKGSKEAQRWVSAPPSEYLYSFTTICTTLGIPADTLRRRLEEGAQ
jgi:hypothetical protein